MWATLFAFERKVEMGKVSVKYSILMGFLFFFFFFTERLRPGIASHQLLLVKVKVRKYMVLGFGVGVFCLYIV